MFFVLNMGGWTTNLLHNKYSLKQRERKERKNLLIGWCFSSTHTWHDSRDVIYWIECTGILTPENFEWKRGQSSIFYSSTKYFLTDWLFFPLSCRQSYVWLLVMIMAAANDEDDDFVGGIRTHTTSSERKYVVVIINLWLVRKSWVCFLKMSIVQLYRKLNFNEINFFSKNHQNNS